MRNIKQILIFLFFGLATVFYPPFAAYPQNKDYLIGIFGIPEGKFDELTKAGVNSLLISEFQLEQAKGLNLKKIYFTGINPKNIKGGINDNEIDKRVKLFTEAGDAYRYYLGDDLKGKHADVIQRIKQRLGIKSGIVGVLRGWRLYPEDDILKYHYPLMRNDLRLSDILKNQVKIGNDLHSINRKLYIGTQAHPQLWYREIIKLGNMNERSLLYPDGQVVRMLIYYAMATGADGYFLYNHKGLSGPWSIERLEGAAQAILETRPLTQSLSSSTGAEFFQKTPNVFGTKIRGEIYDLLFIYNADLTAHYHPTTIPLRMNLNDIIDPKSYKAIYKYSPLGSIPVTGAIDIPQDHALILIAFRDRVNIEPFQLSPSALGLYAEILQSRADKLSANLKIMGMDIPPLMINSITLTEKINRIIRYIDKLNEMKRDEWLKISDNKVPMDGDTLNRLFFKKELTKPDKKAFYNFYYR
jgi:hypothetical protein